MHLEDCEKLIKIPLPGDEIKIYDTCPVCNKKIYKHIQFAHCKQNHLFNRIEGNLYKRSDDQSVTYCDRRHKDDDEKTDEEKTDKKELDTRALIGDIQQYYLDLIKSLTKGTALNPAFTQGVLLGGIQTLKQFGYDAVIDINVKITKRTAPIGK